MLQAGVDKWTTAMTALAEADKLPRRGRATGALDDTRGFTINELKIKMEVIMNEVLLHGAISKTKENKIREEFKKFMDAVQQ